jgi:hypothetical protein
MSNQTYKSVQCKHTKCHEGSEVTMKVVPKNDKFYLQALDLCDCAIACRFLHSTKIKDRDTVHSCKKLYNVRLLRSFCFNPLRKWRSFLHSWTISLILIVHWCKNLLVWCTFVPTTLSYMITIVFIANRWSGLHSLGKKRLSNFERNTIGIFRYDNVFDYERKV